MKNLFYALTFFSFVTACSDNSVQNPTPPPVSDNGDNNNMQVVEFLRNRAMVEVITLSFLIKKQKE